MVEHETIKVLKSMVRVHPVSLLFLQKGENGCLSNDLTYFYATRIHLMRDFYSVGNGRKNLKKSSYSAWVIDALKRHIVGRLYPKKSGLIDEFIIFVSDF